MLREQLQQGPPEEAIAALDSDHPISLGKLEMAVVRWWKWKMRTSNPMPVQVASMDKGTVLRLLGLITNGNLLKRGAQVEIGVSRWSWALLARLPERGELTSEEIGVVRELGKKAIAVGKGLREDEDWDERVNELEATFDEEDGPSDDENGDDYNRDSNKSTHDDRQAGEVEPARYIGPQLPPELEAERPQSPLPKEGAGKQRNGNNLPATTANTEVNDVNKDMTTDDVAAARARLLARLNDTNGEEVVHNGGTEEPRGSVQDPDVMANAKWNTKATIDMIVTIAGEMYGQRDLLQERSIWEDVI